MEDTRLGITWDHHQFYFEEKAFIPSISNEMEKNCNTIKVTLPSSPTKAFEWNEQTEKAKLAIKNGYKILWHFDFEWDRNPIDPQMDLLSCSLAVEHFVKTLWPQFAEESLGALLFQGNLQFFKTFLPLEEREKIENRQIVQRLIDLLPTLTKHLPYELPAFLAFDLENISSYVEQLEICRKDFFEHFVLAIKGAKLPLSVLSWENGKGRIGSLDHPNHSVPKVKEEIGVLYPNEIKNEKHWNQFFDELIKQKKSFRILYENFCTEEWDELDDLIVLEDGYTEKIERILQGFIAAGGNIVSENQIFSESTSLTTFLKGSG